ncbi:MAG: hypothetical protein EOO63_01355 [Hymenobacter sp.]|nr:MAG: hypothetical protein EOO63_01355 [Hymenobacter sp.]
MIYLACSPIQNLFIMASAMNEALYGKEVAEKMERVDAALSAVNQKHKDYFSAIKSKYKDEASSLSEFMLLQWNSHQSSLSILPELREDIAEEARQAFKSVK